MKAEKSYLSPALSESYHGALSPPLRAPPLAPRAYVLASGKKSSCCLPGKKDVSTDKDTVFLSHVNLTSRLFGSSVSSFGNLGE